jgi:hypothetical protein
MAKLVELTSVELTLADRPRSSSVIIGEQHQFDVIIGWCA